ncbi:MAG: hypothetical protein KDK30_08495 [Leptospiraceae bacterium]|nr:hypothetical protein [Leptospiraceae bacterium]
MYYENSKANKKGSLRWLILAALLLAGAGVAGYFYGPDLYYAYSGDTLPRMQHRAEEFAGRIGREAPHELLLDIEEMRRVLDILEKNDPAQADVQYLQGLLVFYEMAVRIPFTDHALMQLTGRRYLPVQLETEQMRRVSDVRLGQELSIRMRKALAIDPEFAQAPAAQLLIAYGDLFYTGRTDPQLVPRMDVALAGEVPAFLIRYRDWMGLALYALTGERERMQQLMNAIQNPPEDTEEQLENHLTLDENVSRLILCHGYFFSKNYLEALQLARQVKYNPAAATALRVEATRMEGEIFYIQRSPGAAIYFLNEAWQLSEGKDTFIERRLSELEQQQ